MRHWHFSGRSWRSGMDSESPREQQKLSACTLTTAALASALAAASLAFAFGGLPMQSQTSASQPQCPYLLVAIGGGSAGPRAPSGKAPPPMPIAFARALALPAAAALAFASAAAPLAYASGAMPARPLRGPWRGNCQARNPAQEANAKTGLGRFCISFPERLTEKAKATCAVPWPLPWQRLLSPLSWHEPQPCRQPPPGPLPWQRLLWLLPPKACQLGRSAMVRALR